MTDMSGQRQARARVLEFLQTKEEWQDYTQEVSEWLDRKAIELRLLIEEKSLSYCE